MTVSDDCGNDCVDSLGYLSIDGVKALQPTTGVFFWWVFYGSIRCPAAQDLLKQVLKKIK